MSYAGILLDNLPVLSCPGFVLQHVLCLLVLQVKGRRPVLALASSSSAAAVVVVFTSEACSQVLVGQLLSV
jgi:hypothetical protein